MKRAVLAAAGSCIMGLALAQSAADNAANAERMERAKRDAANPLRMIIEAASQAKPRGKDAAPAPAAPVAATAAKPAERKPAVRADGTPETSTARTTATPGTSAAAAAATSSPNGIAERVQPLPAAAAAIAPASAPVPAPALAGPATPPRGGTASDIGAAPGMGSTAAPSAAAAVLPSADATPSGTSTADPSLVSTATRAPAAAARVAEAPLKLIRYIEPDLPQRLRSRLRSNTEVTVTFRVNPDGSISDPDIRNSSNRALDPIVLEAVRQWRYEAVPESRIHAVQLVFNLDN